MELASRPAAVTKSLVQKSPAALVTDAEEKSMDNCSSSSGTCGKGSESGPDSDGDGTTSRPHYWSAGNGSGDEDVGEDFVSHGDQDTLEYFDGES
jgi:hypothetical protein